MLRIILGGVFVFLVYSNPTFRSYTVQALQTLTNLIQELPKPESTNDLDMSTYD